MIVFDRDLSDKELRRTIVRCGVKFGVNKVCYNRNGKKVRGTYNALSKNLYICLEQSKKDILTAFFHELGHHVAVKTNKWKKYHLSTTVKISAEKIFDIENGIDKIANKLWNKHVNTKVWGKYKYSYPKSLKNFYIKNIIPNIIK